MEQKTLYKHAFSILPQNGSDSNTHIRAFGGLLDSFQWRFHFEFGAGARFAFEVQNAADLFQAILHIGQTVARGVRTIGRESAAIVGNGDH